MSGGVYGGGILSFTDDIAITKLIY